MDLRRGMKSWAPSPSTFKLGDFLDRHNLPHVPHHYGHVSGSPKGGWGMLGNNKFGSCVPCGSAHETMIWARATGKPTPLFTEQNITEQYLTFNKGVDEGTDPMEFAKWRRNFGLVDARGNLHKIKAYGLVDIDDLDLATYMFGTCGIGLMLPSNAEKQFDDGVPWNDLSHPPNPKNGHYVCLCGRNSKGLRFVVTWGRLQGVTDAYIKKYWAGGLCYFSTGYLFDTGLSPEALNEAKLDAALQIIT